MQFLKKYGHYLLSFFVAFVFIQSLFFKFTDSPETQYIFEEKLEPWAQTLGFHGLFAPGGIFSAHVVGSFELMASILIVTGTFFYEPSSAASTRCWSRARRDLGSDLLSLVYAAGYFGAKC